MQLSTVFLQRVVNVNSWATQTQWSATEGNVNTLYFQIVDLEEGGIRYLTQATAYSVSAIFPSICDDMQYTIVATQPFADDKSIWKVILTNLQVPHSGNVQFSITEDTVTTYWFALNGIRVNSKNPGGC